MKVFVIGLDCAPPELVFDEFDLPNIQQLMECYGELTSTIPAITCPAWMSMVTGKNPGKLGFYGFRNRKGFSYTDMWIANSLAVKEDTLWDIFSREGKDVSVIGVPQTYPPKPVNGIMVTSFLTPDINHQYTYPDSLKTEIKDLVGEYVLDVEEFRTEDKRKLLSQIYEMTEKRCNVVNHYLKKKWDFFMWVEMGPDRLHHGLWKYFDTTHRKYKESDLKSAIPEYYQYLDNQIGEMLHLIDDDTCVIVVSDHGAKKMEGCININDWLIQEGYLHLKEEPSQVIPFKKVQIDWKKTSVWAWGGYYSRIFFNVKNREEEGILTKEEYYDVREDVKKKLESMKDDRGAPLKTKAFRPEDIYTGKHVSEAPDLIVYFGDLYWRATESVGHDSIYSFETEIGPDDCVHAQKGIFILKDPEERVSGRKENLNIMDFAPTVLDLMGSKKVSDMDGHSLLE
ncbi:MAG: alkaline phosphatase family protein [Theionarchaea archaeon]|nr:alkaline phosphatase family protein [Theionarchaea archaeon]MBU7000673.1 alkaline phosphatase family protein [Theionarchaea archaeon]MBU7021035.1 alkaline phosphatase family protein [Theionarchaea archaeon]